MASSSFRTYSSASTTSTRVSENELERRRTAYKAQAWIKDEQRKAEQGISTDQKIAELFDHVEEQGRDLPEGVQSIRTAKAEGEVIHGLIQVSITELDKLRDETAKTLDLDLFVARIKNYAANKCFKNSGYTPSQQFAGLGKHYAKLMQDVPEHHYLRPCIELSKGPQLREKRPRNITKRIKLERQEIRAKTLGELQAEKGEINSVSKELDNVKRQLRAYCKQQGSTKVDYYKFVLNPHNFGETIENMFYVSFLIQDLSVRLQIDPESGCPKIVKVPREEREQYRLSHRSDTNQVVGRLDYSAWQNLVKKYGIQEALIKRPQAASAD